MKYFPSKPKLKQTEGNPFFTASQIVSVVKIAEILAFGLLENYSGSQDRRFGAAGSSWSQPIGTFF